jgi:hypothetical protein
MSMTQLVLGTACGFLIAQGALYGVGWLLGWARRGELSGLVRSLRPAPGSYVLGVFIKYAAPVGVSAALITLGVWAVSDYLAAKSARNAEAKLFDSAATAATADPHRTQVAAAAVAAVPAEPAEPAAPAVDPYADPGFKVLHKVRRAGAAPSLKETLIERSEARARSELLSELQRHAQRSQYDCEAAARADRYLKAGLDVWGFAAWQVKYFPADGYHGATLEQCKDIKNVVASSLDLQAAVAQQDPAEPER